MIKKWTAAAAAALMTTAVGAAWVPPADAGMGVNATLTVTKAVEGTAPADAEFVINIFCEVGTTNGTDGRLKPVGVPPEPYVVYDEDVTFGAEGGSKEFVFPDFAITIGQLGAVCTITEVTNGGADSSTGPVEIEINRPALFNAEIVNTFDAEPATTPEAVRAAPTFTG